MPLHSDVVVLGAVRTPLGRRNGQLAGVHPVDLLATVLRACVDQVGIDPLTIDQVVGGCISQVGEQGVNITRRAWLSAGLPVDVAATTVDSQCGSSQQASSIAASMVGSGAVDVVLACGVESMTRVPLGSSLAGAMDTFSPPSYAARFGRRHTQFDAAERIAETWGITRRDCDELGLMSQQRAARAWDEGRFASQVVAFDTDHITVTGAAPRRVERDEGLRDTSLAALERLVPVAGGVHTAGTSSQIADGAAAMLVMSAARAEQLGLHPAARIVDHCLVGSDPVLMLTGPIAATRRILAANDLTLDDMDMIENNEAFAAVVLAWAKELSADLSRVNPNGGSIAIGHALGATGIVLMTKAVHELTRTGGHRALVTMCCGGGLGTASLLERC